jgi:CheY-like chemotaxis protein
MNWKTLGKITLLIADDDAFNRQLIIALLAKIPTIKVLEARDGMEALNILHLENVNMLLLDYHMPNLNGAQTLDILKKRPRFAHIPVAIITTDESEMRHLYGLGADDFIMKPFNFKKLESSIYRYVERSQRSA